MATSKFGLPGKDLDYIRARDRACVYCHKTMNPTGSDGPRTDWATIEHLNHLPPWDNAETVAICCWSCNSSRGNRLLRDWFTRAYCRDRGINEATVAAPVREYLRDFEDQS